LPSGFLANTWYSFLLSPMHAMFPSHPSSNVRCSTKHYLAAHAVWSECPAVGHNTGPSHTMPTDRPTVTQLGRSEHQTAGRDLLAWWQQCGSFRVRLSVIKLHLISETHGGHSDT
jgi:hypothetical protein